MTGITQWIRLALDRATAAKAEEELKQSLKRGTDPKAAEQNLGRIEKRLDSLVGVAKKAGAAMLAFFAVRKVADFAAEMFHLGTAAEETASKFTTTFGAASKQVEGFIEQWGRLAGLNKTVAQEMTATAGAIVQGMGMSREASAGFSERMLRLAGDMQSFHNVPIGETFTAIKAGLVGSWEPLDRFGIVLRQADVDTRALAETGKSSAAALTQQEKAVAALSLMYERAGPALGDLERTQDSTANKARALQADFQNLKIEIAEQLMPAFTRLVDTMSEYKGGFAAVGGAVATAISWMAAEARAFKRDLDTLISVWEKWQSVSRKFYGNERILEERRRAGLGGTGTTQDMRSDNERQRDLEGGVHSGRPTTTTGTTTPPRTTTGTGTGKGKGTGRTRAQDVLGEEISLLARASELRVLTVDGIARAITLEDQIRDRIAKGNLTLKERVDLEEKLQRLKGMDLAPARTFMPALLGSPGGVQSTRYAAPATQAVDETALAGEALFARIEDRSREAAETVASEWAGVFSQIGDEITSIGGLFDALWGGVLAGAGMAVAAEAKSRAGKSAMEAIEEGAKAVSAFALGKLPQAGAHLAAAAKWASVTAGWSALAGGAMQVAGAGRGGYSGAGTPAMDRNPGRGGQEGAERHTYVYVSVQPFDPKSPVQAHQVGKAVKLHYELSGKPEWAKKF
jgi:hypothetical protein